MSPEQFVNGFRKLKDELVTGYIEAPNLYAGGAKVTEMGLVPGQTELLREVLNLALTDALYSVLLALDGCASLGGEQHLYEIRDQDGNRIDGELEGLAYEAFQLDAETQTPRKP